MSVNVTIPFLASGGENPRAESSDGGELCEPSESCLIQKRLRSPACQTSSIKLIPRCQRLGTHRVREGGGGGALTPQSFVLGPKGLSAPATRVYTFRPPFFLDVSGAYAKRC